MKKFILFISATLLSLVFFVSYALADTLEAAEHQITSSPAYETTPTLGHNDVTGIDYVVYTLRDLDAGAITAGDIWYQPIVNGAISGSPVQVTSGPFDDQLNDCSGDYIVYTAYDTVTSNSGSIRLYQISTGNDHTLGTATIIQSRGSMETGSFGARAAH
jgi:hypothetical protein